MIIAAPPPLALLSLGVTGHGENNSAFVAHCADAESALQAEFAGKHITVPV